MFIFPVSTAEGREDPEIGKLMLIQISGVIGICENSSNKVS
jgi:hypothetical protein